MIPDFTPNGYLPAGIHTASLDEVLARFGTGSELRRVQSESLAWSVGAAKSAGVRRFIVNGSFVTDVSDPNDVDCVLLIDETFPLDANAEVELLAGFPFLEIQMVDSQGFELLVEVIFATDRKGEAKGVVEVLL